jgi:putative SOS response-associated peptidase YedK
VWSNIFIFVGCGVDSQDQCNDVSKSTGVHRGLRRIRGIQCAQQAHRPSHNIGPYAKSGLPPVLIADESGNRVLVAMKWGVEVDSSSHATPATFNARAETLSSNNTWKHLVQRKRCVAVVDGFFEWKDKSTPMFARRTDGELMFLAALYDVKTRIPDGNDDDGGGDDDDDDCDARAEVSHSFTIITMRASEEIRFLHDRMPVILNDDQIDRWLGTGSYASVVPLMRAFPAANLEIFQVSTLVNSLKNKV